MGILSQAKPITSSIIVLKKFDGDGPEDRTDTPLEVVTLKDGQIVSHVFNTPKEN